MYHIIQSSLTGKLLYPTLTKKSGKTASLEIIELGQFYILAARDSPWYKIKQSLQQAFWFLLADFPLSEGRWRGGRDLCSLSS